MIIGNGFVAKNFKKKNNFIKKFNIAIYASGVSNSRSKNKNSFLREKKKLINYKTKIGKKILVYISTCSIFDPSRKNKAYVKHKLNMENLIKSNFKKFIIARFPEVIGFNNNPSNLINFFYQKINNNKKFKLWFNSKRNIIDIDHAVKLLINFIKKVKNFKKINLEVNIANKKYLSALHIIKIIEKFTSKKAIYNKIKFGSSKWRIVPPVNNELIRMSKINFSRSYLKKSLNKYYS